MIILCILIYNSNLYAQCFAQVSLDRTSVYIQQPFKITITVYTPTWYTAPLDFDNIQIPNAFILSFDRTQPGMFTINNKQYAGLQFYFIAFPYHEGNFTVPSINIFAQTPPEGSAVSKKVSIHTEAKHFTVKPIPENMKGENWLVAKNVSISEKWSKTLSNVKVGDIITRTITIDAQGTLPQFIPQLSKDSLDFASTYLQDASLVDQRNDYDANGRLTQSVVYLLEKEGDFTIPAIPITWWNPNSSKRYSRSAAAKKIHVETNSNLGILTTLKDSLQSSQIVVAAPPKKTIKTFFGIAWYWFLAILLAVIVVLYELVRISVRAFKDYQAKQNEYLKSESYAFKQFMHAPFDLRELLNRMYRWWDKVAIPGKSAAPSWQLRKQHFGNIQNDLSGYLKNLYADNAVQAKGSEAFKKEFREYRDELQKTKRSSQNKISEYQMTNI